MKKSKLFHNNFIYLVLIFIILLLYFGKTFYPQADKVIYGSDLNEQFFFWKSYYIDSIKKGNIPYWNPYSFSGTPFLAHPSISPIYPFNIIFFIFPLNLAFSIYLFSHLLMGGIFIFIFIKSRTKDRLSGLYSAIVFTLSGYFAVRIFSGHVDIISTTIWIPLSFHYYSQFVEKYSKKTFFLSIFSFSMQILAGYQFINYLTITVFIFYLFFTLISKFRNHFVQNAMLLSRGLIIIILSYGISAIQVLPTYLFVSRSIRSEGLPFAVATRGSSTIATLKLYFDPYYLGNPLPEKYSYIGPSPNYYEFSYFIGLTVSMLLIFSFFNEVLRIIFRKKYNLLYWIFFFSNVWFIMLSLGSNFILYKVLYDIFPQIRLFRFPVQNLIITVFLISSLVGMILSKIRYKYIKILVILITFIELFSFSKQFIRLTDKPEKTFDKELISIFRKDETLFRVLPDYPVISYVRKDLDFEAFSNYEVQSSSGYNPLILKNYYDFIDILNNSANSSIFQYNVEIPPPDPWSKYIDFLNIKYVLIDKRFDAIKEQYPEKFKLIKDMPSYDLYQNNTFISRFNLVYDYILYTDNTRFGNYIKENKPDFSKTVFINSMDNFQIDPACRDTNENIKINKYENNRIELEITSDCNGILSTSEIYYPGWNVYVDGNKSKIFLSNYSFRAVFIPKGQHKIEFKYYPIEYIYGAIITILSIVTMVFINKYISK